MNTSNNTTLVKAKETNMSLSTENTKQIVQETIDNVVEQVERSHFKEQMNIVLKDIISSANTKIQDIEKSRAVVDDMVKSQTESKHNVKIENQKLLHYFFDFSDSSDTETVATTNHNQQLSSESISTFLDELKENKNIICVESPNSRDDDEMVVYEEDFVESASYDKSPNNSDDEMIVYEEDFVESASYGKSPNSSDDEVVVYEEDFVESALYGKSPNSSDDEVVVYEEDFVDYESSDDNFDEDNIADDEFEETSSEEFIENMSYSSCDSYIQYRHFREFDEQNHDVSDVLSGDDDYAQEENIENLIEEAKLIFKHVIIESDENKNSDVEEKLRERLRNKNIYIQRKNK